MQVSLGYRKTEVYVLWTKLECSACLERGSVPSDRTTKQLTSQNTFNTVWLEQVGATGLQAARQMVHGRPTHSWCF